MATYSQLNNAERKAYHQRQASAQAKYGISAEAYETLCRCEHTVQQWNERECNGEIQRDEPTDQWPLGRPRRFACNKYGEAAIDLGYTYDRAAAATRKAVQQLQDLPDLAIYWQDDCRGAGIYIYSRAELLAHGGDISSVYSLIGHACYF
jgi:hypothetical protein